MALQEQGPARGDLMGVGAQPQTCRCDQELHYHAEHDRLGPLIRRCGHDIEPGVTNQQRGSRSGGSGQVPDRRNAQYAVWQ